MQVGENRIKRLVLCIWRRKEGSNLIKNSGNDIYATLTSKCFREIVFSNSVISKEVNPLLTDTIHDIKVQAGFPTAEGRLFMKGHWLEDARTVSNCYLEDEAKLSLEYPYSISVVSQGTGTVSSLVFHEIPSVISDKKNRKSQQVGNCILNKYETKFRQKCKSL